MKKLLATTALIALLGAPVWAQSTTTDITADLTIADRPVSELVGDPVFVTAADGAEKVGTATDILIAANGVIAGVLVDTAAVADLSPKVIAVDAQILTIATDPETSKQMLILEGVDKSSVEATSAYDEQATTDAGFVRLSQIDSAPVEAEPQVAEAEPEAPAEQTEDSAAAPETAPVDIAETPQTFVAVASTDVTPEELETAEVFDTNDEQISDVSTVVVTDTGTVEDVVFKLGGFLGFGAKAVAVPVEQVQIMRDSVGDEVRVYVNASEDALKELPAFEG